MDLNDVPGGSAATVGRPELLVLTRSAPSWEHMVEQAGWPSAYDPDDPDEQVKTMVYDVFLERISAGERYRFRLTANPTQSTRTPQKLTRSQAGRASGDELARSVRLGHRTVGQQLQWFTSRAEKWGFELPLSSAPRDGASDAYGDFVVGSESEDETLYDVSITARARRSFSRKNGTVTIQTVTYEGSMVVTDPEALRDRLVTGIGPAKAYGCGLMTLAPWVDPLLNGA